MKHILFFALLWSQLSYAADNKTGILTEPYAGYFNGESELVGIGEGDVKSYTYGARLGYQTSSGFNFGMDYSQGNGDYEPSTGGDDIDFNSKDGGVFIGYAFPKYMKIWATYIIKHESVLKEFNSGLDTELEGDGYNVGIGIRGIPFVSVNLSYQERKIDKIDSTSLSGSDNKIKLTLLSVSLPYNFPWKP